MKKAMVICLGFGSSTGDAWKYFYKEGVLRNVSRST